jgi:hypothetical protein
MHLPSIVSGAPISIQPGRRENRALLQKVQAKYKLTVTHPDFLNGQRQTNP